MNSYKAMDDAGKSSFSGKMPSCPNKNQWIFFRLVDEFAEEKPYAGLAFTVEGPNLIREQTGMTHLRRLNLHRLRTLLAIALCLAASGCSIVKTDTFTFKAELPAGFTISATSYYRSVTGEVCSGHKVFQQNEPPGSRLVELQLPLKDTAKGCSMALKNVVLSIEGQWGPRDLDSDMAYARLAVRDEPSDKTQPFPLSGPLVFHSQCQWLFRTMGPYRYIVKILQCRVADEGGVVQKHLAGRNLRRDQLAGRTVKLVVTVAKADQPYYGRSWLETSKGWKPCIETKETFRCQTPPIFTDFKMPDGRSCTVYPNCVE